MAKPSVNLQDIKRELSKRKFILGLIGVYFVFAGIFSVLIYHYKWDQTATHWAARVFPLPAARAGNNIVWLSTYYRRLGIFNHYANRVAAEQPDILPDDPAQRQQKTLDELVDMTILKSEADKHGIRVTQKDIDDSYKKLTDKNGGADNFKKILADFYGLTPIEFSREFIPEQLYQEKITDQLFTKVKVSHIVVSDENQAKDLIDQLNKGGNFEDLAKNYSQDLTSRDQGGDLGYIQRGQLQKTFEDAVFSMKVNEISQSAVKTDLGYHIIKITDRKDAPISDKSFTQWFNDVKAGTHINKFVAK